MISALEWITAGGEVVPLPAEWDLEGLIGDPVDLHVDSSALRAGSVVRSTRRTAREVLLSLMVVGDSRQQVEDGVDRLVAAFADRSADGRLRATAASGRVRELACRALPFSARQSFGDQSGERHQRLVIRLYAGDPFWRPAAPATERFVQGPGGTTTTFLGSTATSFIRLQSGPVGTVFGRRSVVNNGLVDAYPVWFVSGPGSGLLLVNERTGKTIEVARDLTQGQSLRIDCREGAYPVTVDGVNAYSDLSSVSSLWPLVPGDQVVRVEMTNTNALTEVGVAWFEGHLTP